MEPSLAEQRRIDAIQSIRCSDDNDIVAPDVSDESASPLPLSLPPPPPLLTPSISVKNVASTRDSTLTPGPPPEVPLIKRKSSRRTAINHVIHMEKKIGVIYMIWSKVGSYPHEKI
jgi:hypothetical protein